MKLGGSVGKLYIKNLCLVSSMVAGRGKTGRMVSSKLSSISLGVLATCGTTTGFSSTFGVLSSTNGSTSMTILFSVWISTGSFLHSGKGSVDVVDGTSLQCCCKMCVPKSFALSNLASQMEQGNATMIARTVPSGVIFVTIATVVV